MELKFRTRYGITSGASKKERIGSQKEFIFLGSEKSNDVEVVF